MATIAITVGNQEYDIACDPQEQAHILDLASKLDQRFASLRKQFPSASHSMMLTLCGLMMQDELETLSQATNAVSPEHEKTYTDIALRLEKLAEKFENL